MIKKLYIRKIKKNKSPSMRTFFAVFNTAVSSPFSFRSAFAQTSDFRSTNVYILHQHISGSTRTQAHIYYIPYSYIHTHTPSDRCRIAPKQKIASHARSRC